MSDLFTNHIPKGAKQRPGIAATLYIAFKEDFTTLAALPAVPASNAEKVTISDAHVFAAGRGFIKVGLYPRTGLLSDSAEGDIGAEVNTPTVTGFAPYSKDLKVMVESGAELIVLVKPAQCTDGEYRQLGDDCEPAYLKGNLTSGTAGGTDKRGYDLTVLAANPFVHYAGVADLIV